MSVTLHENWKISVVVVIVTWLLHGTTQPPAAGASTGKLENVATDNQVVTIHGSWAGLDLGRSLIQEFSNAHGFRGVRFMPCDTEQIPRRLAKAECDVGLVLDSLTPSIESPRDDRFESYPLGRFVVYVIVNAKSPVRKVTLEELRSIYRGQVTSWKDVANSTSVSGIELYSPLLARTESHLFRKKAMRGARYGKQLTDRSRQPSRQKLTTDGVIGAVIGQRNAIGFFMLGYESKLDKRVRVLGLAKDESSPVVFPSARTIRDGSYPLTDTMTLYLAPDATPQAREFCEFAVGPQGATISKAFRLFPDFEWQQYLGAFRLKEMKAGKGTPIVATGIPAGAGVMNDLAVEYTKAKATVQMRYRTTSPVIAVQSFLRHGELLLVNQPLTGVLAGRLQQRWASVSPQTVPLGSVAVGIVVHPTNPTEALSLDELRAVFSGQIKQWSAKQWAKRPIHVYGLLGTVPLDPFFREKLGVDRISAPIIRRAETGQIISAVAKDPVAIGFVDLSRVPVNESSVRLVKIIPPNQQSGVPPRGDGCEHYPLADQLTLYVSKRASETTYDMVKFITSSRCTEILARHSLCTR